MPLSSTGFTVEDMNVRRERLQAAFEAASGIVPDWNSNEEFIAIMVDVVVAELQSLAEAHQGLWDVYSPNNATGRALENIAALAGISRRAATFSRATVTLGGTGGVVVPAGKIVRHATTKTRWVLLEDVTLPGDGIVEAEGAGPLTASPGTLTEIVTPVTGWSTTTNAASASLGSEEETNAELRARRLAELARASTGTVPSIQSAVGDVDGVTGVRVVANNTGADITVGAFTVPNTCILVLVLPDPLTVDEKTALADALLSVVSAGTRTVGGEACSTVIDGVTYNFLFDYATEVSVNVQVTVTPEAGFDVADLEPEIEEALTDYFDTLAIGGDVRLLPIWGALDAIEGIEAVSVLIGGVASDFAVADTEIAIPGTFTVV